jgi:hypothetical protein
MPPLRPGEGDRQRKTLRRVLVDRADLDGHDSFRVGVLAAGASITTSPTADRNVVGHTDEWANAAPLVAPTKKMGVIGRRGLGRFRRTRCLAANEF